MEFFEKSYDLLATYVPFTSRMGWGVVLIAALLLLGLVLRNRYRCDRKLSGTWFSQIVSLSLFTTWIFGILYAGSMVLDLRPSFAPGALLFHFLESGNLANELPQHSWQVVAYSTVVALAGMVLLGGLLISTINNLIEGRIEKIRSGEVWYPFKNHIVFIGYNRMIVGLIRQLEEMPSSSSRNGLRYVILTSQDVREARADLFAQITTDVEKKLIFIHGGCEIGEDLRHTQPEKAAKIFVLGDDSCETDCDTRNINSVQKVSQIIGLSKRKKRIECHVLFKYQSTFALFKRAGDEQVFSGPNNERVRKIIDYLPFYFQEMWSQKVFCTYPTDGDCAKSCVEKGARYRPLDYEPISEDSDKYVHLVVVGMTPMGIAMGVQGIRLGCYANFERKKTKITFVDKGMPQQERIFKTAFPALYEGVDVKSALKDGSHKGWYRDFTCVELEFVHDSFESEDFRGKLVEWAADPLQMLTIAICFDDPSAALAAGIYLPPDLFKKEHEFVDENGTSQITHRSVPILVNQNMIGNILNEVKIPNIPTYDNLYPFGMLNEFYDLRVNNYSMAKRANLIYSHELLSQMDEIWLGVSLSNKWSNRYFVDHLPTKCRIVGRTSKTLTQGDIDANIALLSRVEHCRWVMEKLLLGFSRASEEDIAQLRELKRSQPRGVSKDSPEMKAWKKQKADLKYRLEVELRTHDCIIPYGDLLPGDREYDEKMCRNIPWILSGRES